MLILKSILSGTKKQHLHVHALLLPQCEAVFSFHLGIVIIYKAFMYKCSIYFHTFAFVGSAKLVHLSCSTDGVWGVDNNGMVYLRIGIKPPGRGDHGYLNPAWVPVDGTTQGAGAKFNKVFAGPIDWMVRYFLSTECAMFFCKFS